MDQSESQIDIERRTPARDNRSAIVTGGASGIGRALAEELARAGVYVVVADRQMDLAEQVAARIRAQGGAGIATELDVRGDNVRVVTAYRPSPDDGTTI